MTLNELKTTLEVALLSTHQPLTVLQLQRILFTPNDRPSKAMIQQAVETLQQDYENRVLELVQVGDGYRFQIKLIFSNVVKKLYEKRPPRYSRALLETLALVAYRQPITRGEIEEIRGVTVSTNIFKTLLERAWVKVLGHKDLPGRPALYGTTEEFLSYFCLKNLSELPPLKAWVNDDQLDDKLAQLGLSFDADRSIPVPVPVPVPVSDSEEN